MNQNIPPNVINALNDSLKGFGLQLAKNMEVVQKTIYKQVIEPLLHVQGFLVENTKDAIQIGPLFEEAGLWLVPSISSQFWYEIRAIHQSGQLTKDVLINIYLESFRDNECEGLEYIINGWWDNHEFQIWNRHVTDAFDAHKNKKYTLSIPTLLIAVEGIMRMLHSNPPEASSALVSLTKRRLNEKLSNTFLSPVFGKPFISSFDQIYTRPGKIIFRHRIFHGRNPNYDNELDSLRLFLLLDIFHGLLTASN